MLSLSPSASPEGSLSPETKTHFTPTKTPSTPTETHSPNNLKYYNDHLNKSQFNLILINCSLKLLKLIYPEHDIEGSNLRFFIVEILRRSKTSIQTLQISCYYMFKLLNRKDDANFPSCPKKLFLGLTILSSKFNQDHNYSFKSWLKICGCKSDDSSLNLQKLKQTEIKCLELLNYDLYINGPKYENWCNVLLIFGYDFISLHQVNLGVMEWCTVQECTQKLGRWQKFLSKLEDGHLKGVKVNFKQYYANQIGTKVVTTVPSKVTLLFKRGLEVEDREGKKALRMN